MLDLLRLFHWPDVESLHEPKRRIDTVPGTGQFQFLVLFHQDSIVLADRNQLERYAAERDLVLARPGPGCNEPKNVTLVHGRFLCAQSLLKGGLIPDNNGKEGEQMKKQAYVKPRIVGSADVHPC